MSRRQAHTGAAAAAAVLLLLCCAAAGLPSAAARPSPRRARALLAEAEPRTTDKPHAPNSGGGASGHPADPFFEDAGFGDGGGDGPYGGGAGLLKQPFFGTRLEGEGFLGSKMKQLLDQINELSAGVPRVGALATTQTQARGEQTAQRRESQAVLTTLPLQARAFATGGSAANATGIAATVLDALSASVAKDIASDTEDMSRNYGAASNVQGVTVTEGRRKGQHKPEGKALAGGSTTLGSTAASAGERVGISTLARIEDGSSGANLGQSSGIGDRVATRLQAATLTSVSDAGRPDDRSDDDGNPTASAGTVQFGSADSKDRKDYSTTADVGKATNTAATLVNFARANRLGYTRATGADTPVAPGPLSTVQADSTDSARAALQGGQFGTGFQFGRSFVRSRTVLDEPEHPEKQEEPEHLEDPEHPEGGVRPTAHHEEDKQKGGPKGSAKSGAKPFPKPGAKPSTKPSGAKPGAKPGGAKPGATPGGAKPGAKPAAKGGRR